MPDHQGTGSYERRFRRQEALPPRRSVPLGLLELLLRHVAAMRSAGVPFLMVHRALSSGPAASAGRATRPPGTAVGACALPAGAQLSWIRAQCRCFVPRHLQTPVLMPHAIGVVFGVPDCGGRCRVSLVMTGSGGPSASETRLSFCAAGLARPGLAMGSWPGLGPLGPPGSTPGWLAMVSSLVDADTRLILYFGQNLIVSGGCLTESFRVPETCPGLCRKTLRHTKTLRDHERTGLVAGQKGRHGRIRPSQPWVCSTAPTCAAVWQGWRSMSIQPYRNIVIPCSVIALTRRRSCQRCSSGCACIPSSSTHSA